MPTTPLRKKCPECGTRGNWPKQNLIESCPKCYDVRMHHDAIRKDAYDNCIKRQTSPTGLGVCDAGPDQCEACKNYAASESFKWYATRRV